MTPLQTANQNAAAMSDTIIVGGLIIIAAWTLIRAQSKANARRRASTRALRQWNTEQSEFSCEQVLEDAARHDALRRTERKKRFATIVMMRVKPDTLETAIRQSALDGGSGQPDQDELREVAA